MFFIYQLDLGSSQFTVGGDYVVATLRRGLAHIG
jgi:hypothetical protein